MVDVEKPEDDPAVEKAKGEGYIPPTTTDGAQVDENGIVVGEWDADFCGCFVHLVPNCLMAWCFSCVSLAQISARLGVMSYGKSLLVFLGLWIFSQGCWAVVSSVEVGTTMEPSERYDDGVLRRWENASFWDRYDSAKDVGLSGSNLALAQVFYSLASLGSMLYFILVWHLRSKTRDRFSIPGNCCFDMWSSFCCQVCVIAQMATHVKSYRPGHCDFGPVDTLPAYT